ncbi:MAG TPA: hypothetical protein VE546_03365 [Streptomyces sp.]|uniref:hypothetical protein n=1 Tax=Streptomyces sp. TaxID=1931 RepID=UPI002D58F1A0|nr:hypothetical protein [Streptomyces sp.]HZG02614.1 hypothetical protein [Streptomyces sp.]
MTDRHDTGGGKDLSYEAETLASFKKRIDAIIDGLEKSPASHRRISDQAITPDAYGTGFSAAEDLSSQYEKAHERLKTLSRLFGEQLEALGIATQIVDKGYENIEDAHRERFQAIQGRVEEYYYSRQDEPKAVRDADAESTDKSDNAETDFQ